MQKTRHELFDLVWLMPMTKLAEQFELSDVGLRKICVKHQIPLPLRGHWTRKEFGKDEPRPELPAPELNPVIDINDAYKIPLNRERSETKKAANKLALNPRPSDLRTTDQLKHERCISTLHEIKEFIAELEKKPGVVPFESIKDKVPIFPPAHAFSFRYFRSSRKGIPLFATARNAIRAICIADEIFERLEEKGIKIRFEFDDRRGSEMCAVKEQDQLEFQFREPYTKVLRTPALSRIEKQLHNYAWGSEKVEVPKNVLCINLGWNSYISKSFKDSSLPLEHQIEKIVNYIADDLDEKIEDRKQRAIRARENARKAHIREFNQSVAQDRKRQLEHALKESKDLESLIRLKAYLKTMKAIFSKLPEDEKTAGFAWIDHVKTEMKTIQPVETRIKRIKRAAKNPKTNIQPYWFADLLPHDYDQDLEEEDEDEEDAEELEDFPK